MLMVLVFCNWTVYFVSSIGGGWNLVVGAYVGICALLWRHEWEWDQTEPILLCGKTLLPTTDSDPGNVVFPVCVVVGSID